MFRMTKRQTMLSAAVAAAGISAVILTAAGRSNSGNLILPLLLTVCTLLLMDLRRRQGDLMERLKRVERMALNTTRRQNEVLKRLTGSSLTAIARNQWALRRDLRERISVATATLLGSIETERLDVEDRHREAVNKIGDVKHELLTRADETTASVQDTVYSTVRDISSVVKGQTEQLYRTIHHETEQLKRSNYDVTREVEALLQLHRMFDTRAPMPPSGRWAMDASALLQLVALVDEQHPDVVLELGSGTSTVWIAYALQAIGRGRVVSIDHDAKFADVTREFLRLHGLEAYAQVREAPLTQVKVETTEYTWYEAEVFADLDQIDLLVVDGPPATTGHLARFPALPVLASRLSMGAMIILDDANREEEQLVLKRWSSELPSLRLRTAVLGRVAVLRLDGRGAAARAEMVPSKVHTANSARDD